MFPAANYLFKVNNGNTRIVFEICSKLTTKTPERCHACRSDVFEQISHYCWRVSIVDFEKVNDGWI